METITEFTAINAACLSLDVKEAIEKVATEYGLIVKLTQNKHSNQALQLAYELTTSGADGKTGKQIEFEKYASSVGLTPEHYGKTINLQGSFYRIIGIRPNAHKNSVRIESARGKEYVCSPRTVLNSLVK